MKKNILYSMSVSSEVFYFIDDASVLLKVGKTFFCIVFYAFKMFSLFLPDQN